MGMRHLVILIGMLTAMSSAGCWRNSTPSARVICMDDEIAGEPDCDRLPAKSAAVDHNSAGGIY